MPYDVSLSRRIGVADCNAGRCDYDIRELLHPRDLTLVPLTRR